MFDVYFIKPAAIQVPYLDIQKDRIRGGQHDVGRLQQRNFKVELFGRSTFGPVGIRTDSIGIVLIVPCLRTMPAEIDFQE